MVSALSDVRVGASEVSPALTDVPGAGRGVPGARRCQVGVRSLALVLWLPWLCHRVLVFPSQALHEISPKQHRVPGCGLPCQ